MGKTPSNCGCIHQLRRLTKIPRFGGVFLGGNMKILYLKDAPQGNAGDVAEVEDMAATVLIHLGFAEKFEEKQQKTTKTPKKGN